MAAGQRAAEAIAADDHGFVLRIAAGEVEAEREFLRRYQRGVRALVRRHARPNDPIVDDLVQEVLANVLERLRRGALRDPASLPAYVRSAVVFCTRAEFRRGFRRVEAPIEEAAQVPATDVDPAEALARDGEGQVVRRLLAELPVERDREILRRHYLSEESKDSVCHALGIDDAHFRRVLHRAKQRLRELLEAAGLP